MAVSKKIIVDQKNSAQRLDVFLSAKLKLTRSQAQKMIAGGLVLVNEKKPKKAGEQVKENDKIVIASEPRGERGNPLVNRTNYENNGVATSSRHDVGLFAMTPLVVAKTPDYIVVNKPSGLLVHPTQANEKETVTAWLLKKYPEIKKVGDDPKVRPGIVHRLDKEASGLLVVARTQKMFNHLKNQFKNRTVEKEYFALVHGKVSKDWDVLEFPIARSENFERMAARPLLVAKTTATPPNLLLERGGTATSPSYQEGVGGVAEDGAKDAKTEFFVEKRFVNFTLLKVMLHTGRMHQIRVHMLAYNHPLIGDPLYKQKKRKSKWDEKCGRLFLHSAKLSFTDLNGDKQTFESPLPEELEKFLESLK